MLEVISSTSQLLVIRERSWDSTKKLWVAVAVPVILVPFCYGLSYAHEINWLALFFIVNGFIQVIIFGNVNNFCLPSIIINQMV